MPHVEILSRNASQSRKLSAEELGSGWDRARVLKEDIGQRDSKLNICDCRRRLPGGPGTSGLRSASRTCSQMPMTSRRWLRPLISLRPCPSISAWRWTAWQWAPLPPRPCSLRQGAAWRLRAQPAALGGPRRATATAARSWDPSGHTSPARARCQRLPAQG